MPRNFVDVAVPGPFPQAFSYSTVSDAIDIGSRVLVPLGNRKVVGIVVSTESVPNIAEKKVRAIETVVDPSNLYPNDIWKVCLWAANYYHYPIGEVLIQALPKLLRDGLSATPKYDKVWQLTSLGKGLSTQSLKRAPKQKSCIQLLQNHAALSSKTLKEHGIASQAITALKNKALIEQVDLKPRPLSTVKSSLQLNAEQQYAAEAINNAKKPQLLFGVTGSGKTEVYLAAISAQLAQHKQVLVILPEINLTPQFVERFESRLGIQVEALHSNLTDRQRLNVWCQARDGDLQVVIGTRSAIFTPFKQLGLIVVDEEHSASLKQQEGFKYSARDLAVYRAKVLNIPCVLGSATPSLETYDNAKKGRYGLLELTQRAKAAQPPKWQTIDLRQQVVHSGISEQALVESSRALARGEHVLFYINRLGYAPNILCQSCGWHGECQQCDVNLRVFLNKQQLRCGHCDFTQAIPKQCPNCGEKHLHTTGQGTEQVETYLQQYFQNPIIRIDSETTQRKGALEKQLSRLKQDEPCIIVGTQMMAKGHDFDRLNLVIILNADDGFVSSDYRANEKVAQALTQVAGRAGRGQGSGRVLVQTYQPDHPLLWLLQQNNYSLFAEEELKARQTLQLSPASYDAHILVTSKQPSLCQSVLAELVAQYQWKCQVMGPQPASLARKAGWFRSVLTMRSSNRRSLHESLKAVAAWFYQQKNHRIRWSIDIDPIDTE